MISLAVNTSTLLAPSERVTKLRLPRQGFQRAGSVVRPQGVSEARQVPCSRIGRMISVRSLFWPFDLEKVDPSFCQRTFGASQHTKLCTLDVNLHATRSAPSNDVVQRLHIHLSDCGRPDVGKVVETVKADGERLPRDPFSQRTLQDLNRIPVQSQVLLQPGCRLGIGLHGNDVSAKLSAEDAVDAYVRTHVDE